MAINCHQAWPNCSFTAAAATAMRPTGLENADSRHPKWRRPSSQRKWPPQVNEMSLDDPPLFVLVVSQEEAKGCGPGLNRPIGSAPSMRHIAHHLGATRDVALTSDGFCGFTLGCNCACRSPSFCTEEKNQTYITEFILLGFGDHHEVLQIPLFLLFLLIYFLTMAGNILIILLIATDRHLHTPMYFFLGNLSCLETCCSSNILLRLLSSFLTGRKTISVNACFVQLYLFASLGSVECYLLSAMSYDRYIAIRKPLHYVKMMNGKLCLQLIATSWISGFLASTLPVILISKLGFCISNKLDHFFCDPFEIIELSCSDTHILKLIIHVVCSMVTVPPFTLTLTSYLFIIVAIMKIPSTTGKQKAFSTCSSHLLVVIIFYGTLISVYVIPNTNRLNGLHKIFSVFYTILTPILNPIIYSLRNKEVKDALRRLISFLVVQTQKKSQK
ncbi:olfactory receptor 8U9-like [Rhineura floridana]|uniref:olfactory receptor 8U9-like n=1 Tax=Rhineura floridana TaxID=261503 RepID=UPI002AC8112E|nr:olfactory receptor 8U9-like [Rhineura floridana]